MKNKFACAAAVLAAINSAAFAATYYADPAKGSNDNNGSAGRPWKTAAEAVYKLKAGDTLLLKSGWHGSISFYNLQHDKTVTVAAAPNEKPHVSSINAHGQNWTFKGLAVSPSLAPEGDEPEKIKGWLSIVTVNGNNMAVEGCFIFGALDASGWTAQDWMEVPSGLALNNTESTGQIARDNYVLNTRFGISLSGNGALAEGNVVDSFSGDGMRATFHNQTLRRNIIRNIYVSGEDGDQNHDDGIQCFLNNKGTGRVENVTLEENLIISCTDDALPFRAQMQGIGFFDGPLVGFKIRGNLVLNNTWHGLSIYDGQNCLIEDNVVFSRWTNREQPWLLLGDKKKEASGNIVQNNFAPSFNFKSDPEVKAKNNEPATEAIYKKRESALLAKIHAEYGATHKLANRAR